MKVSDFEAEAMKHALGWPKMYRNHYSLYPDSIGFPMWESLVERGLAQRSVACGPRRMVVFRVTEAGRAALGEKD